MGTRNCNALTAKEKAALVLWIKEQSEDTRTYGTLAAVATEALGFAVTESNIQGWWNAVNGPRKVARERTESTVDTAEMAAEINRLNEWADKIDTWSTAIATRLANIEKRLTW